MTAVALLQGISWALFLFIALVTLVDAVRRPRRASIDTALFFGAAALLIVVTVLGGAVQLPPTVLGVAGGSLIMALPYLLVRLVDDFADLPTLVPTFALVGLVLSVVALFAFAASLPPVLTLLLVLYFVGLTLYASLVVVAEARRATGVTRRRLGAIAAGSVFLGITILWAGFQALLPSGAALWAALGQISGIATGVAYFLGFATPMVLRRAWQEPEVRAFLNTAARLAPEVDVSASIQALEEGVAVALGASQASIGMWDEQAGVLRYSRGGAPPAPELRPGDMVSGRAFSEQRPLYVEDVSREGAVDGARYRAAGISAVLAAPMTAGVRKIGVMAAYATRPPLFAADDLALVELLAQLTAVILDYARTYEAAAARTLAERERDRLQQVLEVLPEAVLLVGSDGGVVSANGAARAIGARDGAWDPDPRRYGARTRHLDGAPYDRDELPIVRSLRKGETVRGERLLLERGDGAPAVPLLVSSAPLRDGNGTITGAVAVYQDITELRRAEQEKDAFLSSVSHDLKNPLMAMAGHVQLMRRRLRRAGALQPDQLAMGFQALEGSTEQMTQMVNQLLDVSRLQMGRQLDLELAPVDLVAMVRRVAEAYQRSTERHRLSVEAAPGEIVGEWDGQRLERVLANLLGNAIKYSPEGGAIEVRVSRREHEGGACAEVAVRDEGVGIPAADLSRIFDRFYRASNVTGRIAGSGIGLAGAKQIAEQHGGTITVESTEGVGSTFTLRLPLAPPRQGEEIDGHERGGGHG